MKVFDPTELKKLYTPDKNSTGEQNGQVTIIGGSSLFHGAPLFSLKVASRIVDMVFFASPEPSVGRIAEQLKSRLLSFIWVPFNEAERYIAKSDAVLIGPGLMRYKKEKLMTNHKSLFISLKYDAEGKLSRNITKKLLVKFPAKKWVIDAGSLQTMDPEWIPAGSILTPNRKEFEILFNTQCQIMGDSFTEETKELVRKNAAEFNCTIVLKGVETVVSDGSKSMLVRGGNAGLTKGGTGDILAGLTTALLAKNDPFLAACSASYIAKSAADELYKEVGINYNADDLADKIPYIIRDLT